MSAWEKDQAGHLVLTTKAGRSKVTRHGEGRKYWGVTYPDGTYTHNALTQAEAKAQAEAWQPDHSLVQLLDESSGEPDSRLEQGQDDLTTAGSSSSAKPDTTPAHRQLNLTPLEGLPLRERRRAALENLRQLVPERERIIELITQNVIAAREKDTGWYDYGRPTWDDIGKVLGVTKQSAQSKYGKLEP